MNLTKHAEQRIIERSIPNELIASVIESGRRVFFPMRQAIEYRHRVGQSDYVVVVSAATGTVITAYARKRRRKYKYET